MPARAVASMVAGMESVIFGAQGQLGHALAGKLPGARRVVRGACDVTVRAEIDAALPSDGARLVFNATAYNQVDAAEREPDLAFAVNAFAAGQLASAARRIGAKLVHYSTDYVFGNGHTTPIDETIPPDPLSVYGRSKAHGERLALQNNVETLVVRTTGLYSHRRSNFVKTMIKLGASGRRLTVVSDQFVSPTWVDSVAATSIELAGSDVFGVYHVTAQGGCSWYEFAARIFEILKIRADLHAVDHESWGAAARRPGYSVLDDAMLRASGVARVGRWDDELERFLAAHGQTLIDEATAL